MSLATARSLPRREEQRERVRVVAREDDDDWAKAEHFEDREEALRERFQQAMN